MNDTLDWLGEGKDDTVATRTGLSADTLRWLCFADLPRENYPTTFFRNMYNSGRTCRPQQPPGSCPSWSSFTPQVVVD
jgi:hypothetical protein